MENSFTALNTVKFSNLFNWSVQYLVESDFAFNEDYELVSLGSFLTRNKTVVNIIDDELYTRVTVSSQNKGIKVRDVLEGKHIGTKRQYRIEANQFLMSKIDARNGAFGIVPRELDGAIVTNDFPSFIVDEKLINIEFLVLITTTKKFIEFAQSCSSGTTGRRRIDMTMFLSQKIPLPTLEEQNYIVAQYNSKSKLAEEQENDARELEEEIENYILESLGLSKFQKRESSKGLQFINYKNIERWDILAKDLRIISGLNTSNYELKKLGEVFKFPSRSWKKKEFKGDDFHYIELGAIDEIFGITEIKKIALKKAPSRATQKVQKGDLIIGTTRPYLKRFAIVTEENDGDICSSGFSIIAPNPNYDLTYLKEFLFSYYGIEQLKNRMTGATYPAITNSELKEILIPFPPVQIQREIGNHIDILKQTIIELKRNAEENRAVAIKEFEREIFSN